MIWHYTTPLLREKYIKLVMSKFIVLGIIRHWLIATLYEWEGDLLSIALYLLKLMNMVFLLTNFDGFDNSLLERNKKAILMAFS